MGYGSIMSNDPDQWPAADTPADETSAAARPAPMEPRREPIFNLPAVVVALIVICATIHVIRAYVLTPEQDFEVLVRAAFIPIRYSGQYDLDIWAFVSPLSYAFLHGGIAHLLLNMVWFAAFGSPLANRLGVGRFLLFWVATSLGAVALHYVLHSAEPVPLVGASGAISGMMGAAARFGFRVDRSAGRGVFSGAILPIAGALTSRTVVTFLVVWFAINLITGLVGLGPDMDAAIAWEAHIGGFLVGFFAIGLFDRASPLPGV